MSDSKKILIVNEEQVKTLSLIQLNVDSKILRNTIQDTQMINLRPILGDVLYYRVLDEIYSKVQDSAYVYPVPYGDLIADYIVPFLIHSVVRDFITTSTYKLGNKGILKYNDTSASSLNGDEIESAKNYHDNRVSSFKSILIKYLEKNKLTENVIVDNKITDAASGWYLEKTNRYYNGFYGYFN